jgi:phosphatidylethanolamine/phosphatidyl-N-methylethanolamine N-methyltransferase
MHVAVSKSARGHGERPTSAGALARPAPPNRRVGAAPTCGPALAPARPIRYLSPAPVEACIRQSTGCLLLGRLLVPVIGLCNGLLVRGLGPGAALLVGRLGPCAAVLIGRPGPYSAVLLGCLGPGAGQLGVLPAREPHVALANRRRYARLAPAYDVLDQPFESRYRPGRRLVGSTARGLTLELGAGTGKNFPYYEQSARVLALDLAWPMLARARRRLRPPIRALLVADAAYLPLRDASLDTVTATFVCCVQPDPRPVLAEIARVLRPGGQVLLLEFVLPARGLARMAMRLSEPALRAVYGLHCRDDLPARLSALGLHVHQVQPIWAPIVEAIFATRTTTSPSAETKSDN